MLKTSSVTVHLRSNGMAVKSVLSKFATLKAKSFKSIKFDLCGATHRNSGSLGSFLERDKYNLVLRELAAGKLIIW